MSQISDIITAIGNLSVTTQSQTPVVYSLANATESVRGTPARVVLPMQLGDNEGRNHEYISLGSVVSIQWIIADLMLYAPVKQGSTLQSALPELVTYAGNYITAMKSYRKLGLQAVTVEEISYEWNQYIFPEKTSNEYYGVLMMLTVREVIQ